MKLVSHRGNINGPNPEMENDPRYVENTLAKGFSVEVDVWSKGLDFYLGHDKPEYQVSKLFLRHRAVWCHAKTIETFYKLIEVGVHCFSHDQDEVALTTKGYLWSSYGNQMTDKSICVMPPRSVKLPKNIAGVCSDYIGDYK